MDFELNSPFPWNSYIENTDDIAFLKDSQLRYICVSSAYVKAVGLTAGEILGKTDIDLFPNLSSTDSYTAADRSVLESGKPVKNRLDSVMLANGRPGFSTTCKYPVTAPDGTVTGVLGICRDVTSQMYLQETGVHTLEGLFSPDILLIALFDLTDNRIIFRRFRQEASEKIYTQTTVTEFMAAFSGNIVGSSEASGLFNVFDLDYFTHRYRTGHYTMSMDYQRRLGTGAKCWVRDETQLLTDPESGHLLMRLTIRDIDRDHQRLAELSKAAETDAMTGLYNHASAMSHIEKFLDGEGRGGAHALFMVDVDNFKRVNDSMGHQQGDSVITSLADILNSLFRGNDIIGRVGGDEFLILMKNVPDADTVRKKAAEMIDSLQFSCALSGQSAEISCSVGVSLCSCVWKGLSKMFSEADTALYSAKNEGKSRFCLFDDPLSDDDSCTDLRTRRDTIQLQTLMENMDGGVTIAQIGEDVELRYMSPSFLKAMGRSASETGSQGENLFSFVLPEDVAGLKEAMRECAMQDVPSDHIYRVREHDGSVGWRHMRMAPLFDSSCPLPQIISVVTNVTRLQESTVQLEAIIANAPCGIGLFNLGTTLTPLFVNDTLISMLGSTREQYQAAASQDFFLFVQPSQLPKVKAEAHKAMASSQSFEITFTTTRLAKEMVVKARCVKLPEVGGEQVILIMFSDVTWETTMNDKLRFAEERYRTAAEQMACMIWEVDLSSKTFFVAGDDTMHLGLGHDIYQHNIESLKALGVIDPDSYDEAERMLHNIYSGDDSSEYYVRVRDTSRVYTWHRASFKLLRREGVPYYAIGVSEMIHNIDDEMRRFRQEVDFAKSVSGFLEDVYQADLSRDEIRCLSDRDGSFVAANTVSSYGAFLGRLLETADPHADRDDMSVFFTRDVLRDRFSQGKGWIQYRYLCSKAFNGSIRRSISVNMIRHPINGDLYAFFYFREVDVPWQWESGIGFDIQRDTGTLLYNSETYTRMVSAIIAAGLEPGKCAVFAGEIKGFDKLQRLQGDTAARQALFDTGRALRLVMEADDVVGCNDRYTVMWFVPKVESVEVALAKAEATVRRFKETFQALQPGTGLYIVMRAEFADTDKADYGKMLAEAIDNCVESVEDIQ